MRLRKQLLHTRDEVRAHGAAHAAVVDLDEHFIVGDDHLSVDTDLAEFVDHDADAFGAVVVQQMIDERRLAGAEKAGDNSDGNSACLHRIASERSPTGIGGSSLLSQTQARFRLASSAMRNLAGMVEVSGR